MEENNINGDKPTYKHLAVIRRLASQTKSYADIKEFKRKSTTQR